MVVVKRAETLSFDSIKCLNNKAYFYYHIDNLSHSFNISLNSKLINLDENSRHLVLAHIGLSFLIDIASICLPRNININTIHLSKEQLKFWQWVYRNITLERLYEEKKSLACLSVKWQSNCETKLNFTLKKQKLGNLTIAMSGGKESLTALKIYKKYPGLSLFFLDYRDKGSYHLEKVFLYLSKKFTSYKINTNISHTGGLMDRYNCNSYSLHVIGQIVFNSLLYSDKIDYLFIGNEYSSNFGNGVYLGEKINHQFDKGLEFSKRINEYIKKYFNGVMVYTSPFFGLYEYKIGEVFFKDKYYFNIWTSCNYSNKKNNFCCKCPKCAFIYIISLAYSSEKFLNKFFFQNPLYNLKLCKSLIDIDSDKPTDCVGEKKECWLALYQIIKKNKVKETVVTKYFQENILPKISKDLSKIELELSQEHTSYKYLPKKLARILQNTMAKQ